MQGQNEETFFPFFLLLVKLSGKEKIALRLLLEFRAKNILAKAASF